MSWGCVKNDKNVFKLTIKFFTFLEIPEILKTHARKKINFRHYRAINMSRILIFWSNYEIKMVQSVVFRLNCEIKMLRNSTIAKKTRQIKMPRKFHARKFIVLK